MDSVNENRFFTEADDDNCKIADNPRLSSSGEVYAKMHWDDQCVRKDPVFVVFTIWDEDDNRMLWSNYILVYRADTATSIPASSEGR